MANPPEIIIAPRTIRDDGSVPFKAPQPGVNPVAGADLVTKQHADASFAAIGQSVNQLTQGTNKLLGRTTAGTGPVEQITVGSGLSLSAGSLTAPAADHGTLTGLGDDDHTQYIPVNASRQPSQPLGCLVAPTLADHYIRGTELTASQSAQDATILALLAGYVPIGGLATSLIQNTNRLLGRTAAGAGAVQEITVGSGLSLTGGSLSTTGLAASGDITASGLTCNDVTLIGRDDTGGGPAAVQEITLGGGLTLTAGKLTVEGTNLTGDVTGTVSAPSFATTISSGAVSLPKMANLATDRLIGRATAGTGVPEAITCTAAGRALLDDADATAQRATLGLVIGTNVQAQDSELTAIAGLASAADRLPYFTGSGTAALATFTAAGRAIVDDADASAQRTTLGLGTSAVTPATDYQSTLSTELTYVEDFVTIGLGGWTSAISGANASVWQTPATVAANPGVMRVMSGTASGGSACAYSAPTCMFFAGTFVWEGVVALLNDAVGTVMQLGVSSLTTGTADPADGVFFEYAKASSANWRIRARKASVSTTTTTSTAVSFSSFIKLRITYDGTTATFLVNGSSVGTIAAANIPTAAVHPYVFVTQATANAWTAIDVDRVFVRQVLSR